VTRKHWIGVAVSVAALIGAFVAYDALTVTDEEIIEGFVDETTGTVDAPRIQMARDRWVDLERQPFEVSAMGRSLQYGAGDDDALAAEASRALAPMRGANLRVLSRSITVEGDQADANVRLLSRARGMGQVSWRLRKHGDDWLVERLSVTR